VYISGWKVRLSKGLHRYDTMRLADIVLDVHGHPPLHFIIQALLMGVRAPHAYILVKVLNLDVESTLF
jgi:hypothetical protein